VKVAWEADGGCHIHQAGGAGRRIIISRDGKVAEMHGGQARCMLGLASGDLLRLHAVAEETGSWTRAI